MNTLNDRRRRRAQKQSAINARDPSHAERAIQDARTKARFLRRIAVRPHPAPTRMRNWKAERTR